MVLSNSAFWSNGSFCYPGSIIIGSTVQKTELTEDQKKILLKLRELRVPQEPLAQLSKEEIKLIVSSLMTELTEDQKKNLLKLRELRVLQEPLAQLSKEEIKLIVSSLMTDTNYN